MLRKLLFAFSFFAATLTLSAQNNTQKIVSKMASAYSKAPNRPVKKDVPSNWTYSVLTNLNFFQSSYTNWAKGGTNTVSLDSYVDANANYVISNMSWNNHLQLSYGFFYSQDKPILQKGKDRILLESTWGYKMTNTTNYSAKFIFLSQFSNGYKYKTPTNPKDPNNITASEWKSARLLKSGFLSPANITLGLGIDWIPDPRVKINFAPLTGGFVIVSNPMLRQIYGMNRRAEYKDLTKYPDKKDAMGLLTNGEIYKAARFQFGAQLTFDTSLQINNNFTWNTELILFSDYLYKPQNVTVNWTNMLSWQLAKYFSVNLTTDLVYDDRVLIISPRYPNGHKAVQFLQGLKLGFTYSFVSKSTK